VVDVEQHALRALEQDALPAPRASLRAARPALAKGRTKPAIRAQLVLEPARSILGSPKPARSAS
jgi:hypothetical protein